MLVLLVAGPVASGQAEGRVEFEDERGDEEVVGPTGSTPGDGRFPQGDLIRYWIGGETLDEVQVGIQLASATDASGNQLSHEQRRLTVYFETRVVGFRLLWDHVECGAQMTLAIDADGWKSIDCVPLRIESAGSTIVATMPKQLLAAALQDQLRTGDSMTGLHVTIDASAIGLADDQRVHDEAQPDDESAGYAFKVGLQEPGPLHLITETPIRFHNGGTSTFVFPITVQNRGPEDLRFAFAADAPEAWKWQSVDAVSIGAGDTVEVPIVLSVDSAHKHGVTDLMQLHAIDLEGGERLGTIPIGLTYPEVPNPAGHHPDLYFHSYEPATAGLQRTIHLWMNTLDEDPDPLAADASYPASSGLPTMTLDGPRTTWDWAPALSPELQLGLDFEADLRTQFTGRFTADAPAFDVFAVATLSLCLDEPVTGPERCPGGRETIAASGPVSIGDIQAGPFDVALDLTHTEFADYVPYQELANLQFIISMEGTGIGGIDTMHWNVAESKLALGVVEYADRAADLIAGQPFDITIPGTHTIQVNPGRTAVVPMQINNTSGNELALSLRAVGAHSEGSAWRPAHDLRVGTEGQEVELVIRIPADAPVAPPMQWILLASDADGRSALAQIWLEVTDAADIPDATPNIAPASEKPTPFPGAVLVLAAILLARRRP